MSTKAKIKTDQVVAVFKAHKRRYGTRRIVAELKHQSQRMSRYMVRKVMANNGLKAIQPKSFVPKTTDSRHPYKISPNLLKEGGLPIPHQ